MSALKETLTELLMDQEQSLDISQRRPFVILVVGVNGAGKTTTIGKLAHRYKQQGLSVMLAAGDTFRAAAVEQLQAWGSAMMSLLLPSTPARIARQCCTTPLRPLRHAMPTY